MASNSEKKEKSLAEFIVIVALVGMLMAIFINFFIKNEARFTHAGFATIAIAFNTKVNAVHAQWMMDKQPNIVYLASLNKSIKQAVTVNKAGWIDAQNSDLPCEEIWQLIMEVPMHSLNYPISAIEVNESQLSGNGQNGKEIQQCRYVLLDGSYFQYNRSKGKVSKVIEINSQLL